MNVMADRDISEQIRERAYNMWEADGRPDGQAMSYWLAAESEVKPKLGQEASPRSGKTKAAKSNAKKATKTKRTTSRPRKK